MLSELIEHTVKKFSLPAMKLHVLMNLNMRDYQY